MLGVIHMVVGIAVMAAFYADNSIPDSEQEVFFNRPKIETDPSEPYTVSLTKVHLGSISPIFIHALVSMITGISHGLTVYFYPEFGLCPKRANIIRWSEYSVTATLMTMSGYVSLGEGDILFLITMITLGMTLQLCGYLIESNVEKVWEIPFYLGVLVEIAIVVPLITLTHYVDNRKEGIVEGMVFYGIYYSMFAMNAYWDATRMVKEKRIIVDPTGKKEGDLGFMITDERYAVLSFTSKMALFWITIGSLKYHLSDNGDDESHWLGGMRAGMYTPLLGGAVWLAHQRFRDSPVNPIAKLLDHFDLYSPTKDYFSKPEDIGSHIRTHAKSDKTPKAPVKFKPTSSAKKGSLSF